MEEAKFLRFPGTCRCEADLVEEFEDFESWEVWEESIKNENYAGLIEYCKREVTRDPEDLHAWESLGAALADDGRFVIEPGPFPGFERVRVRRKREGGAAAVRR